jgi:mRNA interferase RelE/StbE
LAYNIVYKKSIQRDLRKISRTEGRLIMNQGEVELSKNADAYPVLKRQFAGLRKYRIGDYRVIYAILGENVLILRIGHRRHVYKWEI